LSEFSSAAPERPAPARAASRPSGSARLGRSFRTILAAPNEGLPAAFASVDRRKQLGERTPEGVAPYVLGALGGAQLMLLWLKLGGLLDLRSVSSRDFKWSYVVVAIVGAGILVLIAQYVWGSIGRVVLKRLEAPADSSQLRFAWGAAALPQVLGLVVLFPLDILIVGRNLFTSERIVDTLPALWAALSVAFSVSLAAWSLYLFFKAIRTAAGASSQQALVALLSAFGCFVLVVGGFLLGAVALAGGTQ
jgi:hypothetical protein